MRFFQPESTQSSSGIANWVFVRSTVLFFLTLNGALIAEELIRTGIPVWVFGLWFWFQLLFRAIGAYERVSAADAETGAGS